MAEACLRCGDFVPEEALVPLREGCPPPVPLDVRDARRQAAALRFLARNVGGSAVFALAVAVIVGLVPSLWKAIGGLGLAASDATERVLLSVTFIGMPGFVLTLLASVLVFGPILDALGSARRKRELVAALGIQDATLVLLVLDAQRFDAAWAALLVEGPRGIAIVNDLNQRAAIPRTALATCEARRQWVSWPPRTAVALPPLEGVAAHLAVIETGSYRRNAARTRALAARLRGTA